MELRVACRDLTVAYGDHLAVDAVTFEVAAGEVFGLLGPNGAGKTSVIRALTTIIDPVSGSATVAGHDLRDPTAIRWRIGVLPESSGYPRAQTGPEYLQHFGQIYGLSKADARVRAAGLLHQFGLDGTSQRIAQYSRGMRQRLGLCRSMINEPDVLFLDEPTLGLDPAGKEEIVRNLGELAASEGTAVLLCTHLLDEVERVCDRVAIMNEGKIVTTGTVPEIVGRASGGETARLRVDPSTVSVVADLAVATAAASSITVDESRPGVLDVAVPNGGDGPSALLRAVLDADVEVLAFERHRASLTDAFLELTAQEPGS